MLSEAYQSVVIPGDALLLVRVGVREALNLTGLAAKQAVQVWADLVALALLQRVALSASGLDGVSIGSSDQQFATRGCLLTLNKFAPFLESPR